MALFPKLTRVTSTIINRPAAPVNPYNALTKDFMECAAWEYVNSRAVTEKRISAAVMIAICGICQRIQTLFSGTT